MNHEEIEFPLPEWATGRASKCTDIGAQLRTKDGRRCGNAVTVDFPIEHRGLILAHVLTDAGSTMLLTESEMDQLFFSPEWTMDIASAPGTIVQLHREAAQ